MLATFATGESMRVVFMESYPDKGSNHSLRRRNLLPHHRLRLAHRNGEGLENRLRRVMSIAAANEIDVDVAGALVGERFEKLLHQREGKIFVDQEHLAI